MAVTQAQDVLTDFLDFLYERDEGYVCIATTRPPARKETFNEKYFDWPKEKSNLMDYIEQVKASHNVYFCVNLLSAPKRRKDNAVPQNLIWADLDTCAPTELDIPPQCVIESSPGRFQAIWRVDSKLDPLVAESYSKKIAYAYADLGADKSGHDLTQLLRVPTTYNYKYQVEDTPPVYLRSLVEELLPTDIFKSLPAVSTEVEIPDLSVPDLENLPDPQSIIYRYQEKLRPTAFARYYSEEPIKDWSKSLWRLITTCFDVGMSADEAFVIAKTSKCNKYERDGRPISHLWREVIKNETEHKDIDVLLEDHRTLVFPALLTAGEEASLRPTIVDEYMSWATEATDAVPIYHEISCAMLLSMLMSTTLRLHTSNAMVYPNLWALILGESTLTRKSTAMDMVMQFVHDIDRDLIVSSDASAEGLLTALSLRPKMVSIFQRDEVTGFFDAINHKEYLRSMPEIMTKMYDVPKYMPRTLQKNTYVVSEPIFIFFGGGVPDKMYSLAEESYFTSGFLPRFLVVNGEASAETRRPTGPPQQIGTEKRLALLQTFQALYEMYTNQQVTIQLGGQTMVSTPEIEVIFPSALWDRAAEMERVLLSAASNSPEAGKALPTFSRMFISILKMTMLFAAARQEPDELVVKAEIQDLLSAAYYVQRWGKYAVHFIQNSGGTSDETKLRAVYRTIEKHPGIMRGPLMQRHRLNAREMTAIHDTLSQRLQIHITPKGKGLQYWPLGT